MSPIDRIVPPEHAEKVASVAREFRDFAFKGNVVDMAVGVIIGAAFAKLIDSLVKHVLMPVVNLFVPGQQAYANWVIPVGRKEVPVGLFIGELVNFLLVALILYVFVVKFLGWLRRTRRAQEAAPPKLTPEQQLLTEIRDLLREGRTKPT